jgi:hypothetical protein
MYAGTDAEGQFSDEPIGGVGREVLTQDFSDAAKRPIGNCEAIRSHLLADRSNPPVHFLVRRVVRTVGLRRFIDHD